METLAIVAYKQPLVRAEMEQIRGVDTAGVLKTLLDRRLIRIVGRKDIPGRPIMYGTTKQFLQAFGLKDLASLPALRDIKDLKEAEQFILPNVDPEEEVSPEPFQVV
jgi:segregation and condensation protein B